MLITSLQNPRIKNLAKFRNRRHRDKQQKILIEGYRGLIRSLDNDFAIEEVYVCPELYLGENEETLVTRAVEQGAERIEVTPDVFKKITYRDRPEGLLAIGPQFHNTPDDLFKRENPLFVVGEAIEKPGNLGTMLRSSDAAGCDGLVVCDSCTDIFNPNVVCSSVGTLFTMPIAEATSQEYVAWCKKNGVKTIATTPDTDVIFTDVDMTGPTAIIMGTEQYGLTDFWLDNADVKVRIPMFGQADSLNVATATTLVLFEAVRQRREKGMLE
ncbi:rRNA methyltransferase [bacterium M21]|nr:rRNA methyltransferase [bacterium M21]